MLDRDLKSLPAGSTALFRDDNLQVVKTAKGSLQIFNQASWSFAELDLHKVSFSIPFLWMHFQGAAVWKGSWYARRPCSPIVLHVLHVLLPSPSHVDLAYLGMLKTRLQGYEVSLHKLVSDLEAFSAKLTNLNPILPILLPRSNSSSWSLICNDKAQSTCKVSTMCILCGMMCDKRPKPCNMVFTKIHQETSADGKNQIPLFFGWTAMVIKCYF